MSVGDQHGPYWALFSKSGKLLGSALIERPGPYFLENAAKNEQRVARVVVIEVHPDTGDTPGRNKQ